MNKLISLFFVLLAALFILNPVPANSAPETEITFIGHATVIVASGGKTVCFDPGMAAAANPEFIARCDLILISHAHFDHDGAEVDKQFQPTGKYPWFVKVKKGAIVVAVYETMAKLVSAGLSVEIAMNGGFGRNIGDPTIVNGVEIVMTQAAHSSASGIAVGYIVKFPDGYTVYYAGDTGLDSFPGNKAVTRLYKIDIAFLPIGGIFTMGPIHAAQAAKIMQPASVVPIHYKSFPFLEQSADKFKKEMAKVAPHIKVAVIEPGQTYAIKAKVVKK